MAIDIPIVNRFTIRSLGWIVSDFRSIGVGPEGVAVRLWEQSCNEFVASHGIDEKNVICRHDYRRRHAIKEARFANAQAADPSLTWASFPSVGREVVRGFQTDPRLPKIMLAVSSRRDVIGAIYISNIEVEQETRNGFQATALIWPAIANDRDPLGTAMRGIQYLIENDLQLDDGRVLDLIGLDVLTDKEVGFAGGGLKQKILSGLATRIGARDSEDAATGIVKFRRRRAGQIGNRRGTRRNVNG